MPYIAQIENQIFTLNPLDKGTIEVNGERMQVDVRQGTRPEHFSLILNGRSYQIWVEPMNGSLRVHLNGCEFDVQVEDERLFRLRQLTAREVTAQNAGQVHAPMPGLVVKLLVEPGQVVSKGQGVVIVEAMKMENEIRATVGGEVKEVLVGSRQAVEKGQVLVVIG